MTTPSNCIENSPEAVILTQFSARDAGDIEAVMACWSDDVQVFQHPDTPLTNGRELIRQRYQAHFKHHEFTTALVKRMTVGNRVIEKTLLSNPQSTLSELAIYHVDQGKITHAWIKQEPVTAN